MMAAYSQLDTAGQAYGFLTATDDEISAARHVRFGLINGTNDFRRGNILDIFNGGFAREGFQAKLFEVQGMAHDVPDGKTLSAVLDFLEASPSCHRLLIRKIVVDSAIFHGFRGPK